MATKKTIKGQSAVQQKKSAKVGKSKKAIRIVLPSKKTTNKFSQAKNLQIISAIVFALLAVAVIFIMRATNYLVSLSHFTKDELASQTTTVLAPASHNFLDLDIRWLLVAMLVLSAIVPLLSATKLRNYYHASVKKQVQTLRWIDLALPGAFLVGIIAVSAGVYDVMTLKLIGALVMASAWLGWISEQQNRGANKPVWSAFIASGFLGSLPWLVIFPSLCLTYIYGMVNFPWYVYVAVIAGFVGFLLQTINYLNYLKRLRARKNYWNVERNYLVINLATKLIIVTALVIGFA